MSMRSRRQFRATANGIACGVGLPAWRRSTGCAGRPRSVSGPSTTTTTSTTGRRGSSSRSCCARSLSCCGSPMTSNKPRLTVLHVTQPLLGGVDRCVAQLVADQSERGWSVAVACRPDSEAASAARDSQADVHDWTASRLPGPATAIEISRLRRIIREAAPDLVHLHSAKAGLAGRLALRGRLPTIFQPHSWSWHAVGGGARRLTVGWERWAARWCDAILCVSEAERALGEAARLDAVFHVVHNGVDPRAIAA